MKITEILKAPQRGESLSDIEAMSWAMEIAQQGATKVSPNPLVGSVVVDADGSFLASGYHEFYGGPHAEVNAVKGLSNEELNGATVYVTLEPCAHEGKTPSCAKMLATLPLKKVIYGLKDPNPLVAGKGAQILIDAGIPAELFQIADPELHQEFQARLEQVCEVFLKNYRSQKVFVAAKIATSLDGQISLANGESKWITGDEAREYSHYLRACYDMICVGSGTIVRDNPALNIRHSKIEKETKLLVIDPSARVLKKISDYQFSRVHKYENIFFAISENKVHAEFVNIPADLRKQIVPVKMLLNGQLDLKDLLKKLYELKIRSLYVEGGGVTVSKFLEQAQVDRLYVFQAPILLGKGKGWTEGLHLTKMNQKLAVLNPTLRVLGKDFMVTGSFDHSTDSRDGLMSSNSENTELLSDFKWVRGTKGWFFGVCDGLSKTLGLEPWILRVIFFLAFYLFGSGLAIYLILAISLPRQDKLNKALDRKILGVCVRIAKVSQIEIGIVRTAFVALGFGTLGIAFLVYLALYFVYPKEKTS